MTYLRSDEQKSVAPKREHGTTHIVAGDHTTTTGVHHRNNFKNNMNRNYRESYLALMKNETFLECVKMYYQKVQKYLFHNFIIDTLKLLD